MAMLNNQRVKYPSIYTNVFNSKDVFPVFHSNAALKKPMFLMFPFLVGSFMRRFPIHGGTPLIIHFWQGFSTTKQLGITYDLVNPASISRRRSSGSQHISQLKSSSQQLGRPMPQAPLQQSSKVKLPIQQLTAISANVFSCQHLWRSMKHDHLSISSIIIINHGQLNKRLL